jgi:hypothetical protein
MIKRMEVRMIKSCDRCVNSCRACEDSKRNDTQGCSCNKSICLSCFKDGKEYIKFEPIEKD